MIAFDDTRESAFQNVAQLLKKWVSTPDERLSAAFRDAAGAVLDRLWELAQSSGHDALAKGSPVEFDFNGLLHDAPWVHHCGAVPRGVRPCGTTSARRTSTCVLQRARRCRLLAPHRLHRERRNQHRATHGARPILERHALREPQSQQQQQHNDDDSDGTSGNGDTTITAATTTSTR
ncbi:hypothetical protein EDB85DRAFT_1910225 [Lactarius pseudohatsudake]|nr:hypothetical protein EDB85DRAFT_1910225 [Lactarius pseudohatsudake]